MRNLSYYFKLNLIFENNADVHALAQNFNAKPYKIITKEEALGVNKTAKIWYKTEILNNYYLGELFNEYVLTLKNNFPNLKQTLKQNNGEGWLDIVFQNFAPCSLFFNSETINILNELGLQIEVDFLD